MSVVAWPSASLLFVFESEPLLRRGEAEDCSSHRTRPASPGVAFGGCSQGCTTDNEVARLINALPLVPGLVRVEVDSQRGCQHSRSEILCIIAALLARHAIAVML